MGVISARKKSDPGNDWLGGLIRIKPLKVVAIALANRMARAVWAMLREAAKLGARHDIKKIGPITA
jgi:transposase